MNNTVSAPSHNLPAQLIPIVGREKEILEITGLLADPQTRLITLHGFGGTGKTRLALEIGRLAADSFADGVWFVALAPLNSPDHLLAATAAALGFTFGSALDQKQQLFSFLQVKKLLLIFDNLEHLLPEALPFLEEILQNAPYVRLLVTSRQPLNTPWEWTYSLRGLDYPEEASATGGKTTAAAELFLQHLRRGGHPLEAGDAVCAAQIGRLVNGLPLALLLAASWGRALGCDEIIREIKRGIGFLKARQQTPPDKHSSMQAVFDYSWRLLSESERIILRKLSVFRGGFDRAAASEVSGADLTGIASLVDQSLVERMTNDRYQIHELLRQYLQDQLAEAGEDRLTRDAHLGYYAHLAEQAEPELFGAQQNAWIERLGLEMGNLSAALDWSLKNREPARVELALRLMVATDRLWTLHLFARTGIAYLAQLLAPAPDHSFQRSYALGLILAGRLSFLLQDLPESRRLTAQALQIGLDIADKRVTADACYYQGVEAFHRGDFETAQSCIQKSLTLYQGTNYAPGMAQALTGLGRCEMYAGHFPAAMTDLTAALAVARQMGDVRTHYSILRSLGELATIDPQIGLQQARAYYLEGMEYARKVNDKLTIGIILNGLGEIERLEGKFEQATLDYKEAIVMDSELGRQDLVITDELNLAFVYSRLGKLDQGRKLFFKNLELAQKSDYLADELLICLLGLAGVAAAEGDAQLAVKIFGAIDAAKEPILRFPTDRSEYERIHSAAKAQLTEQEFGKLFREGQALGLAEMVQLVQNPRKKGGAVETGRLHGLTGREIEVLRLVTSGLSDVEVAERLVISPRTVNAHLTSIYNKLGVNSRVAAARFAFEKGLV